MRSALSLPLLRGPHKLEVVAPNRIICMNNFELFDI